MKSFLLCLSVLRAGWSRTLSPRHCIAFGHRSFFQSLSQH